MLSFLCLALLSLTGFRQENVRHEGPGEWRQSVDPVWVYEYHTLRLQYRATGLPASETAILTLRPGSVGPVTPGAKNIENPFVAGMPGVVVRARDLIADGAPHTLDVELRGRMRTAQIDQLQYALPAGATLTVDALEFTGDPGVFPYQSGGPALPDGAVPVSFRTFAGSNPQQRRDREGAFTSLRGRETIRLDVSGRRARTLYLSLMAHFAGVAAFGKAEVKESGETAHMLARLSYTDGAEDAQYPLLAAERRHVLLNGKAALYTLDLDTARTLASVELQDRSVHAQLALFHAGLSQTPVPQADLPPQPAPSPRQGDADLSGSAWYKLSDPNSLRADLRRAGDRLSLSVTNTTRQAREFTITFPSLAIQPAAEAADVYYLFPRQGAVVSNADAKLESLYSGIFPLQFVDVFSPRAGRGAALIVRDTSGQAKKFRLRKEGSTVHAEVDYTLRLAPGQVWNAPEAQVTLHGGDWREGFSEYRAWLRTWYKPAGPRPAWLQTAFWARRDYPIGGTGLLFDARANRYTFPALVRDGAAFGGIDFIDISGWALSEKLGRVGDYPLELGGAADLRRNIEQAGVPTGLYFEGYLIDKNSAVGRRYGKVWQMFDEKGKPRWWSADSPELLVCPYVKAWQQYLSRRIAQVARQTKAAAVYLDEFGFGKKRCYAKTHGHAPGIDTLPGEIAMAKEVRRALAGTGTILYLEETPPDAAAPLFEAAFCYNLHNANRALSPLKLNLSRFMFPELRLWDMLSTGIDPRALPAEDFRLSLWHGNGIWLKGHSDTWYGEDLLAFLRHAHGLLTQHAEAFSSAAEPLVASPHPAVFINRFSGARETVYTLFNASYRTAKLSFQGRELALGPRQVEVVSVSLSR